MRCHNQDAGWRIIGSAAVGDGSSVGAWWKGWRGARDAEEMRGLLDAWGIPRMRCLALRASVVA
jgi:hypothetical protein